MDIRFLPPFHSCLYEITIWMCSEETAVRLNTLKLASMGAETRCSIYIYIFVNCHWVANHWQYYSTHLHTNSTQNETYTEQHN